MRRIKTGIPGLDELVQGGVPEGSSVLVGGGSGCGKTILGMQYIYQGALDFSEPGIFITLEGNVKNIAWNMASFKWDIKKLQDRNLMRIYRLNLENIKDDGDAGAQIDAELGTISDMAGEIGAKRLAVDSTSAFAVWLKDEGTLRNALFKFTNALKDLNCTTLLTSETKGDKTQFSTFGIEEFVADGIIALYFTPPHRSLFVRKMRGTNHSKTVHPFEITERGIVVQPKDEIMWEAIK
ncbi:MAG: ATPase domain-containing protein [Candidatus Diapherotrites archaeon]